ncbi:cytochrome c oxidase subunit 3 [Ruegeria sp. HKCCD7559]|uniref:cytochrome c oxidase subunit 3 n=1 Tax=Ruegeria sp. HKCCD7559 TaxID=2683005 RepID=UPI0014929D40|nr:cytochrome c oxidase subunit 3 [Ruegeria sp. HKCCD7559]NOC46710.1 cytochrome o ubiquinol oxidase subunit III [Ruegeria sp. HKCCD7559]
MKRAPTHSYPGINLGERHASADKATEVVTFGFWVFLMSDLVYFGLMFAIYITMVDAQAGGPGPHELFDLKSVFAQTLILLTSSLTVGLAMLALKYNLPRARIVLWFGVTLFLGISFLVLEVRDFMAMAEQGGIPQRSGFLSAFFGLVPLHGLHVAAGCLWLIVLGIQLRVKGMTDVIISRVVRLALFWRFLDLIWIGIITIVYFGGLTYG